MPSRNKRRACNCYIFVLIVCFYTQTALSVLYDNSELVALEQVGQPFPYVYPDVNAQSSSLFPMRRCQNVTLEEATIDQLQNAMGQGILTAVDVVNCYLERIEQTNGYIK